MAVTRFAPSPTGSLHIGGIRTALYDYAMAKKTIGKFILRIEDTDRNRYVEGSEQEIKDMLSAYGLPWEEEFRQSDRLPIYKEYADKLIESGAAYYCFTTKEELEARRMKARDEGTNIAFRSPYRDLPLAEVRKMVAEGKPFVIRQKLPENHVIVFDDPVQGKMSFNTNDLDETVLLKGDGFPTYHLAVVIDDHLMGVTDVFRGVEWLPSVPKHVLLYKALGWEMPVITHLPVILDPDGGKLSKRRGAVSARGFLEEGYLPEAILNFLMLLGWSSPIHYEHGESERELFTLKEFTEFFDMKDLNKASPVFNREKLLWFNQKYIQAMTPPELTGRFVKWLNDWAPATVATEDLKAAMLNAGQETMEKILLLEQTRMKILSEVVPAIAFYFKYTGGKDILDTKQTKNLELTKVKSFFRAFVDFLSSDPGELSAMSHETWEGFVRKYSETNNLNAGALFMTMRVAVTDSPFSPPLFEVMQILGKNETIRRVNTYLA